MSICEYFNCESINDLVVKIKHKDPSVKELISFIEAKKKESQRRDVDTIDTPEKVIDFYQKEKCLAIGDDMLVVYINSELKPVFYETIKIEKEMAKNIVPRILEYNVEGIITQRCSPITKVRSPDKIDFGKLKDTLEEIGVITLDQFVLLDSNKIMSQTKNKEYVMKGESISASSVKKEFKIESPGLMNLLNFETFKDYDEIIEKYVEKEIVGLNAFKDEEKIKELIKLLSSHKSAESLYYIRYDNRLNVSGIKELFKGQRNEVSIDILTLMKEMYETKAKYMSLFHNHPESISEPSTADIVATKSIRERLMKYDINLLEHYTVARDGVKNISDIYISMSEAKYQLASNLAKNDKELRLKPKAHEEPER